MWFFAFGDTRQMATELMALVVNGTKATTASLQRDFTDAGAPVPCPGDLSVVLDGQDTPQCVLRTTEVAVKPLLVDVRFAGTRLMGIALANGGSTPIDGTSEGKRCGRALLLMIRLTRFSNVSRLSGHTRHATSLNGSYPPPACEQPSDLGRTNRGRSARRHVDLCALGSQDAPACGAVPIGSRAPTARPRDRCRPAGLRQRTPTCKVLAPQAGQRRNHFCAPRLQVPQQFAWKRRVAELPCDPGAV
jgi:ASCH domain